MFIGVNVHRCKCSSVYILAYSIQKKRREQTGNDSTVVSSVCNTDTLSRFIRQYKMWIELFSDIKIHPYQSTNVTHIKTKCIL